MTRALPLSVLALVAALAAVPSASSAQEPAEKPEPAAKERPARPQAVDSNVTALMVEVTIARWQGDKRLSSTPYVLAVTPGGNGANLRMGGQVPIVSGVQTPSAPDARPSITYRDIGTNIDVSAFSQHDGRYRLVISLEDSSVYPPDEAVKDGTMSAPGSRASGAPAFRSLRTNNAVTLKDGQSVEFLAATDRVTGEVARLHVKMTVVR